MPRGFLLALRYATNKSRVGKSLLLLRVPWLTLSCIGVGILLTLASGLTGFAQEANRTSGPRAAAPSLLPTGTGPFPHLTSTFRDPASQFIEPTYFSPAGKSVGAGPFVVGDFNGDGLPDVAEVVWTDYLRKDNKVNVLLNAGGGVFTLIGSYSVPDVFGVILADVNGDGRLDLITQNTDQQGISYSLSVLLGNGDGTFSQPVSYAPGVFPQSIVAGDFNGDGHLDLIIGSHPYSSSTFTLLLGRGDGSFQLPQKLSLPNTIGVSLVVADFNGDNKLDLAAVGPGNTVSVLLGKGDGTFGALQSTAVGSIPNSIAAADLNKDGKLDLVVADYGLSVPGDVAVLLGNGDGTFNPAVFYPVGENPALVAAADLNGDGKVDVVEVDDFAQGGGSVFVLFGNGDGTLQTPTTSYGVLASYRQGLFIADMNKTGKQDLVIPLVWETYLQGGGIMFNRGDGTFDAPINYYPTSVPIAVAVGDFNGDGKLDVVTGGYVSSTLQTEITTFLGKGDGTFPTTESARLQISGFWPNRLTPVDLNRDGKLDLLAMTGSVVSLLGNGDGTFRYVGSYDTSITSLAVGDFNGDGIPDVVTTPYGNQTYANIWFGNGDGTFRAGPTVNLSETPYSASVADLNRDGKMDLVFSGYFSDVLVALGNGDGTFQANTIYTLPPYFTTPLVADFNNDGIPDIGYGGINAFCDFLSNPWGWVGVMYGNGDGTFGPPQQTLSPNSCAGFSIFAADLNGDGRMDLIETGTFEVTIFMNTGKGFETWEDYTDGGIPLPYAGSIAVGDFNGDGANDLVASGNKYFSLALNASGVKVGLTSSANPSKQGQAVTFTATVTPTFASQGTPTGTVAFRDGKKTLGTVTLVAGAASVTTSTLSTGTHTITASYSGDSLFVPLTASPLLQKVSQ
jgi:hypothetical protein